ncbi:MAG: LysM peptidoglycan-binding domain-containing protein [Deltaproteobacteria bacterium]|nr:LysM peptidoglycan-binding domain-containing protein [Deltaproteobacteria bacterium]
MNVIIIAALFLSFAVGVNWMVSDKEKSDMKKELVQTQVVKKDMEKGILDTKGRLGQKTKELEELEAKYNALVEEKKGLEETLLKAEEARFIAEKKAESDIAVLKQQTREREDVQDKSSELEARLLAMEEAREKFEAEAREKAEKESRKRAEDGWLQAETARVKAEETLAKKEEAESRLKTEEELRQRTEADLKAKTSEIIQLKNEIEAAKEARKGVKDGWLEAETARAKAEETLAKKQETESRLKAEEELRQRTEADLKIKTAEIIKLKNEIEAAKEAKANAEKEARKRAEEGWLEAEIARAKAEETLAKKEEAESRLKTEEELRQRTEANLKAKTAEITQLENEVETAKKATEKIAEDTVAHAQTISKQAAASFIEAEKPAEDNKSGQGTTTVELKSGEEWREEIVIKYTVLKGDTLWKIAGKEFIYNAPKLWVVIYKYNLDKLKNPNSLYQGQVLLIPKMVSSEDAKDSFLKAKSALEEAQ